MADYSKGAVVMNKNINPVDLLLLLSASGLGERTGVNGGSPCHNEIRLEKYAKVSHGKWL